jgi:IS30 family transposase
LTILVERDWEGVVMSPPISREKRRWIRELYRAGWSQARIRVEVATAWRQIRAVVRELGEYRPFLEWDPGPGRLTLDEREEIGFGLVVGTSLAGIARRLGRPTSTVAREVKANGGREAYRPSQAHRRAYDRARRPKTRRLDSPAVREVVVEAIEQWWSPEQIAHRLRLEYPDDPMMWVSHETIYQSIYVQGRGELRRELARCLRSGRAERRPNGRIERRGRIPGMVSISERPAEVEDRAVPGHWEGDLLVGKNGQSAIATLVERTTRYVLLAKVENQTAAAARDAITAQITQLPEHLRRSLTWDQGREMAQHAKFSVDTGIAVYFCDPHSPWQRGSNENTNGLLRQYFPKGTDLSVHSQEDLDSAAHSLNNRPRETLGWFKPSEKLTELLVANTA